MQRRKTLLNGLANNGIASKEEIKKLLISVGLPENTRGENLSIEQFAELSNKLKGMNLTKSIDKNRKASL